MLNDLMSEYSYATDYGYTELGKQCARLEGFAVDVVKLLDEEVELFK